MVFFLIFFLGPLVFSLEQLQAQQSYVNNKQLACYQNPATTLGNACTSYLSFRSTPTYNSPATIGYLLAADPSQIAAANNISDVASLPTDTLVIVPLNCSCFGGVNTPTQGYNLGGGVCALTSGPEIVTSVTDPSRYNLGGGVCALTSGPETVTSVTDPSSKTATSGEVKRYDYSVWALPPEELTPRLKKLMEGLRSEFGGPQFEPHVTVVGAISLTESEARDMFNKACEKLKPYCAKVEKVGTGTFYYQCVYLLLHPTSEVVEASAHCCAHFGYKNSTPYMPHLSLLYGDLPDEEKKTAQEKAYALDDSIVSLSLQISRIALYKTDTKDTSCKSWEKVAECQLKP